MENAAFVCEHCATRVAPLANGSYRNHCPACLWSKHVDRQPGDRAAACHGLMRPVGLDHRPGKGWLVIHRCLRCHHTRANRLALDDQRQPDDVDVIAGLSGLTP
ncbi:MAG: RNHCP domain-containing protein [Mycobacteriales bacterium]